MCIDLPQHQRQVAALRRDWSAQARSRWRNQQRRLLLRGQVEQVIAAVRAICRGRNSQAIRQHRDYFVKNQSRMVYAELMATPLPIGSGAIEGTVRRVVNLRLKGPSIFWCRASAEAMLLLRSYYKAGRWNLNETSPQQATGYQKETDFTLSRSKLRRIAPCKGLQRMAASHLALLEA